MKNPEIEMGPFQTAMHMFFRSASQLPVVMITISLIGFSCSKLEDQTTLTHDTTLHSSDKSWEDIFEQVWHDHTILVPTGGSIQEAVDVAQPGDAILIEAGHYDEEVNIDKEGIKLVGIPGLAGSVVELSHGVAGRVARNQIINIKAARAGYAPFRSFEDLDHSTGLERSLRINREVLPEGIVHYIFNIRVGGHSQEVIRLHRVVRELRPGKAAPTDGAVFMVHGSSQGFEDIFLYPGTETATRQTSCPVYLANNNLDVWGIDLAWTRLPPTTTDFSLMRDWDMHRDVHHALQGMSVARVIRLLTGHGFDCLNMLGFSYGGLVAYVAAGKETQQHISRRDIKGIIPVDVGLKFAPGGNSGP